MDTINYYGPKKPLRDLSFSARHEPKPGEQLNRQYQILGDNAIHPEANFHQLIETFYNVFAILGYHRQPEAAEFPPSDDQPLDRTTIPQLAELFNQLFDNISSLESKVDPSTGVVIPRLKYEVSVHVDVFDLFVLAIRNSQLRKELSTRIQQLTGAEIEQLDRILLDIQKMQYIKPDLTLAAKQWRELTIPIVNGLENDSAT